VEGAGLKWPNDIYFRGRKLAGILVDLSGESTGSFKVVIGIGINISMPARAVRDIDQPWTDLSQCGVRVDRNGLAAALLDSLLPVIDEYLVSGLEKFAEEWRRFDLVSGRTVRLQHGECTTVCGVARGIDANGALLIEHDGATRPFHAGEVSVRFS
jgi:BirA family biotin operon repressor/biotin-[acetyl-CoA-carboxylase] ligase